MPFSLQYLVQAIDIFCSSQSKSDAVGAAEKHLNEIEESRDTWELLLNILQQQNLSTEVYFISAKMFKSKIQRYFTQLPSTTAQQLPLQILGLLTTHQHSARSVKSQLFEAFNYSYIHQFQCLPDLLQLLATFFSDDNTAQQNCVLSIFEAFADCLFTTSIAFDAAQRNSMIQLFNENLQPRILQLLDNIETEDSRKQLLKILNSWFGIQSTDNNLTSITSLLSSRILINAVDWIHLSDLQELSTACLQQAFKLQRKSNNFNQAFIAKISENIPKIFDACIAAARDSEDSDSLIEFVRVLCEFGRCVAEYTPTAATYHRTLLNEEETKYFLQKMLEISSFPDSSSETTSFWLRICRRETPTTFSTHLPATLGSLFQLTITSTQYSDDLMQTLCQQKSDDYSFSMEAEDKHQQRLNSAELISTITSLIGASTCIDSITQSFLHSSVVVMTGGSTPSLATDLFINQVCRVESLVYCLRAVIIASAAQKKNDTNNLHQLNETHLLSMISCLTTIRVSSCSSQSPQYFTHLVRTIMNLLIASASVISATMSTTSSQQCFSFIVSHLEEKNLKDLSEIAFEKLCKDCPSFVQENFLDFRNSLLLADSPRSFNLRILSGIALAICQSDVHLQSYFVALCQPYASDLLSYANLDEETRASPSILSDLKKPLKAIKTIVGCAPERPSRGAFPHSLLCEVFQQIFPVLKFIIESQPSESSVVESIVGLLKQFLQKTQTDFIVFLPEFLEQIVSLFSLSKQSGILYLVERCVRIFGIARDPDTAETVTKLLSSAFQRLTKIALSCLTQLNDFIDNPELVEDFFGLQARFIKYFPTAFFESDVIMQIITASQTCVQLQHREAAKSLFSFIELLYENISIHPTFKAILANSLSIQFNVLLFKELALIPPQEIRNSIFDVLIAQIHALQADSLRCLQPVIDPIPENILSEQDKQRFYSLLASNNIKSVETQIASFFVHLSEKLAQAFFRDK